MQDNVASSAHAGPGAGADAWTGFRAAPARGSGVGVHVLDALHGADTARRARALRLDPASTA
ncbi:hypothetical protein AB0C61_27150 [Streptomyces sp. NPDC048680]|uniref:hypothetical protein n=1 Tax=Streptomyces sp. NPDC048680 TaxID=3155492 RepID=UPI0034488147